MEGNKTVTANQNQTLSLSISEPIDPEGSPLAISVTALPNPVAGQVLKADNTPVSTNSNLSIDDLTRLRFQAGTGASGSVGSFSYSVSDGLATVAASVNINVIPANTGPVTPPPASTSPIAVNDGPIFTSLGTTLPTIINVLTNDSAGGGSLPLVLTSVGTTTLGTVSFDSTTGLVQFTAGNATGAASFSYTLRDSSQPASGTATATVNIAILSADDNPNFLIGGDVVNNFNGLGGDDTLVGGAGNDTLDGGAGNDTIVGGGGENLLLGGLGDDTLVGGASNDTLVGGAGNDSLNGGGGNDVLTGGLGADTLTGGAGLSDRFRYVSPEDGGPTFDAASTSAINAAIAAGGYDVITDFVGLGTDTFDQINFAPGFPNLSGTAAILFPIQSTLASNILGGNQFLFAYEFGSSTYLIYDGNGNNLTGNDSRILTKLEGVSGVKSLNSNDFTFL